MKLTPWVLSGLLACSALTTNAQNGSRGNGSAQTADYGKNILSFAPFQANNFGPGFGIHYERFLGKESMVSFYLPTAISFQTERSVGDNYQTLVGFAAYPGLKFYPTGSQKRVSYAVGPSVAFNYSNNNVTREIWHPNGTVQLVNREEERTMLGIMVNNSLNAQPTRHLHLGLELGLGMAYLDIENGDNRGIDAMIHFSFKVGYRF